MTDRRRLIQALAVGVAAPISDGRARTRVPSRPQAGWRFFTAQDATFISAAVDRLIPPDDWPGAADAGVPVYIDRQLAGSYGAGARMYLRPPIAVGTPQQGYQMGLTPAALYRTSLDALHDQLRGSPFETRSDADKDAFLRRLEAGELMLGTVPSAVFFETLLANTIEGYFADPMYGGNRDMAGWRMIGFPGAFAAFAQWVDRHGIRFDRPPVSIGMTSHGHHDHGK